MAIAQGTPYLGVAANPAYSGAPAGGVFIPEIWSGKLIEKFYAATVLTAISNTDYEGEIKNMGDKVKIRTKPTITIRDYTLDQTLTVDRPSSTAVELTIDFAKYFNLVLDDIMERQSDMNLMSMWADDASEQLKITIDTGVLAGIDTGIVAANKGATAGIKSANINLGATGAPIVPTKADIIDHIVDMGQVLDEQNMPETGRWLVIPPWLGSLIKKSDLRDASISGDGISLARNGRLGMIDRFTLYSSNLLPTATDTTHTVTRIFGGISAGLTFASQISQMETLRSESTFGTLLRGLQVYGFKVLDGTALVELYAAPS
jgi:HK97 family phage major capsid protein